MTSTAWRVPIPRSKRENKVKSICIAENTHQRLRILCKFHGRPMNWVVETLIFHEYRTNQKAIEKMVKRDPEPFITKGVRSRDKLTNPEVRSVVEVQNGA